MDEEKRAADTPERKCIMTFIPLEDYHRAELWAVQEGCRVDDLFLIWLHERENEYQRFRENAERLMREVKACL